MFLDDLTQTVLPMLVGIGVSLYSGPERRLNQRQNVADPDRLVTSRCRGEKQRYVLFTLTELDADVEPLAEAAARPVATFAIFGGVNAMASNSLRYQLPSRRVGRQKIGSMCFNQLIGKCVSLKIGFTGREHEHKRRRANAKGNNRNGANGKKKKLHGAGYRFLEKFSVLLATYCKYRKRFEHQSISPPDWSVQTKAKDNLFLLPMHNATTTSKLSVAELMQASPPILSVTHSYHYIYA